MNSGQKIPGYSGFIPFKQDLIGLTTGESNRRAGVDYVAHHDGSMIKGAGAEIIGNKGSMRSTSIDGNNEPI